MPSSPARSKFKNWLSTFPRHGVEVFGCSMGYEYLSLLKSDWLQVIISNGQENS